MSGRVKVEMCGGESRFAELSYSYPLKLIAPRLLNVGGCAAAYILGYGGGLVGGDAISLDAQLSSGANLVLLTQGSTKVFKASESSSGGPLGASQRLTCHLDDLSTLYLVPEPVTCFSGARFQQTQAFHLAASSSALIVDWLTPGRTSRGEQWQFHRYKSTNNIYVAGKLVVKDVLLLQSGAASSRTIGDRLSVYSCYASVFLCGPRFFPLVGHFLNVSSVEQRQNSTIPKVIWSVNSMNGVSILRVASQEPEQLKGWLSEHLRPLKLDIGPDLYNTMFHS